MATTTLAQLMTHGATGPGWRIAGRGVGEHRHGIGRLPKAR
ncbi:hypothetical protein [Streptomyces sp. H27-C3]|nr:hypothetical protein [Streptomyces sp. H27-C3]MDJ0465856.1 hypothetical protein [Streptomyces sp. H27-C3]